MEHRTEFVEMALLRKWAVGAMLGLGSGVLLDRFLSEVPGVSVIGVDHFVRKDRRERVLSIANRHGSRCTIFSKKTAEASAEVPDGTMDFVYIDASHKYGCVRSDIRSWWPKVRVGGWIGGHDYSVEYPGVLNAVNERFPSEELVVTDTRIWFVEKTRE